VRASKSDSVESGSVPRSVLVVDDEKLLADTTADILRLAGFTVEVAYGAGEAMETLHRFHPDLLLADVMMPVTNGLDLAIAVTRMFPQIKIMLFSGQAGISPILQQGQAQGFEFPILAKPVHPRKLVEALKG
jgi:CheY-like chemotaxis protein